MLTSPKLTSEGILSEGQGDGGLFKGILVRYLTQLIFEKDLRESDRKDFVDFMNFNARKFYDNGLSRPAMLSNSDWGSGPGTPIDPTTQLSGLMLMEAASLIDEEGFFE
jgi:predicted alpha-1,6-mannanase (GH76 family)